MAVSIPKQRLRPRATLYSPPPSQAWNSRVVAIRVSPGSSRSMTSPSGTRSKRDFDVGVEGGRDAQRGEVGGAVANGPHVVELGEAGDLAQVADAARVDDRRADVVDELLLDEPLAIVDRRKHLADGDGRRRVVSNEPEAFL